MNSNRGYAFAPIFNAGRRGVVSGKDFLQQSAGDPDFSNMEVQQTPMQPVYGQPAQYAQQPPVWNTASPYGPEYTAQGMPQQSGNSAGYAPYYGNQPVYGMAPQPTQQTGYMPGGMQQNPQPVQQPAPQSGFTLNFRQGGQTRAAFSGAPTTQPGYAQQPVQPAYQAQVPNPAGQPIMTIPKPQTDSKVIWTVYLFVFLPLLFVPCLFVSGSFTALRAVFVGLCAAGLIVMWVKKLFNPTVRLIASMVYIAMAAMLIMMSFGIGVGQQQTDTSRQQGPAYGGYDGSYVDTSKYTAETGYTDAADDVTYNGYGENGNQPQNQNAAADLLMPETAAPVQETPAPPNVLDTEMISRLRAFMDLWMVNNASEMVNYVQPSWRNNQNDPTTALFTTLANRTPESYDIEEVGGGESDTSRAVTLTAPINKNNGKASVTYRFTIMMVCEGDIWYVNPGSLATNDTVTQEGETNVVNDSNSKTNVTAAPRTTVTPEPPASSTLYYNPDGGSFYHADQYCPSVRNEFLPLTGTFAYRDLTEYTNNLHLQPCLKCGAPINPPSSSNND